MNRADHYYQRVIPRDLFNESKLLKCIGRLCVFIHDEIYPVDGMVMSAITTDDEEDSNPFIIALLTEGSLIIDNIEIRINGVPYRFKTTYNSKSNFPLYIEYKGADFLVFDDDGNYDEEFKAICLELSIIQKKENSQNHF